jgi:methyltransferase (TIGR00027 family)
MPKPIAFLIFVIIEIVLLPITIMGTILLFVHFVVDFLFLKIRGKKISLTAYDPMFARWFLHALGKREDEAASPLWYALPGVSPITTWLMMGPTVWAMRITGFTINMYNYPVYSSSNPIDALGHRTRFFDDAMLSYLDQVEQVVILGAGWDTRAYSLAQREGVRVFEVDAAETQAQKRQALKKAKIDSSKVIFAPADFNIESWLDALKKVDFDPDQPTFVLMEGVTLYLETEAVEATLQTVATELAKGSAIAFDYIGKHIIDGDASLFYRLVVPMTKVAGEGWTFGIPTRTPAKEQLAAFLEQNGLTLAKYEPIGKGDKKQRLEGGLALAVNDYD